MKIILRIWIVGTTFLLLMSPARLEPLGNGFWRSIPALAMPVWTTGLLETRIAVVQTIAIIIALNFLPGVLLWKWDSLKAWIHEHRARIAWAAFGTMTAMALIFLIGFLTYKPSFDDVIPSKQDSAKLPPGFIIDPVDPKFTLVPTMPATANQTRRAQPVKGSNP
ncbi:MAG: hypothetical protein WCS65_13305 [Verrucomicrobiae bacterium]